MTKIVLFLLLPLLAQAEVTIRAVVRTNAAANFETLGNKNNIKVAVVVNQNQIQPFTSDYNVKWAVFSGPGTIDQYGLYRPPATFLSGTQVVIKAAQIGVSGNTGTYYIVLR